MDPEKVSAKPSRKLQLEDAQVTAGVNTDQTLRFQHRAHLRRQPGRPPFHRGPSSRSRRSRTSSSATSTSPSVSRRGSRSSTTGPTSSPEDQSHGPDRRATGSAYRQTGRPVRVHLSARPLPPHRGPDRVHLALDRLSLRHHEQRRAARLSRHGQVRTTSRSSASSFVGDTTLYQEWGAAVGPPLPVLGVSWAPDLKKGQIDPTTGQPATSPTLTLDSTVDLRQLLQDHGAVALRRARLRSALDRATSRRSTTSAVSTRCAVSTSATQIGNTVALREFRVPVPAHRLSRLPDRRPAQHPRARLPRRRRRGR